MEIVCCPPETRPRERLPDEVKYCFGCRKRTIYKVELSYYEYYDPLVTYKCADCGQDRRQFGR